MISQDFIRSPYSKGDMGQLGGEVPTPKGSSRLNSFQREGGNDLLETRVAAQWIPKRHQFQITIA